MVPSQPLTGAPLHSFARCYQIRLLWNCHCCESGSQSLKAHCVDSIDARYSECVDAQTTDNWKHMPIPKVFKQFQACLAPGCCFCGRAIWSDCCNLDWPRSSRSWACLAPGCCFCWHVIWSNLCNLDWCLLMDTMLYRTRWLMQSWLMPIDGHHDKVFRSPPGDSCNLDWCLLMQTRCPIQVSRSPPHCVQVASTSDLPNW